MKTADLIDLTENSITFPAPPSELIIPVDAKVRELQRKFSAKNQRIIIVGPTGSGKTCQLMQFAKQNCSCVFSYFLSNNYWCWRQSTFLLSLCRQMSEALGLNNSNGGENWDNINTDINKLKPAFEYLNQKVINDLVKRNGRNYYFVIDGLEWAFQGNSGERIIDLLPPLTSVKGLYFLASINKSASETIQFDYNEENPQYFSIIETEKYFSDLDTTTDEIQAIQNLSGGMPGFLNVAKDYCIKNHVPISSIVSKAEHFDALVELSWKKKLQDFSDEKKNVIALLAFSLVPLSVTIISEILTVREELVKSVVAEAGIINQTIDQCLHISPDIQRTYAQKKLETLKRDSINLLVQYYKRNPNNRDSKHLLPEYYRLSDDLTAMQELLIPSYISSIIQDNNDFYLAQRDLRNAIELAKKAHDITALKFGLSLSQIKTLSNEIIANSEIRALVALKKYNEALELAYSIKLISSKIRLLAIIYTSMEKTGICVSRESLLEIKTMTEALNVNEMEPDELVNLATDLFPLLPDLATSMIENANIKDSEKNPLDLFVLLASVKSEDPDSEELIMKVESKNLQEYATTHSGWCYKLPAIQLIQKARQIENIKAKVYLFRRWCLLNRKDPLVHLVLEEALDAITAANYKIPLRSLRQLSEPIKSCKIDHRSMLVERFEIPEFIGLLSPIEERIRLDLNFIEAINDYNPDEAIQRYYATYQFVKNKELDKDVACYCLTRLLITLKKLNFQMKGKIEAEIRSFLEEVYIELIETSADQYEVAKRILKDIPRYDPRLAISFADMLNTVNRRHRGIQDILITYIKQDNLPISQEILEDGLSRIADKWVKEETILKLIEVSKEYERLKDKEFWDYMHSLIVKVEDPIILSNSIANLLSSLKLDDNIKQFDYLFAQLINSWEKIDIIWMRVEAAFHLTTILANGSTKHAEELYDLGRALRSTSPLANESIGVMFYNTLKLATRTVSMLDLQAEDSKHSWEGLKRSIDLIPSTLLQTLLFAQLGIQRHRCGDKATFDELVRDHVLLGLQNSPSSELKDRIITQISLSLYEYSPLEAQHWLEKLPYALRNAAWTQVGLRIITNASLFDEFDLDEPNVEIDIASANKILQILEYIDRDVNIALVSELFATAIAESHKLSEQQRRDYLTKLEFLIIGGKKLPDFNNIIHNGYKTVVACQIECAKRKAANKTRSQLPRNHQVIIREAREIPNIADKVFVLTSLARELKKYEREVAEKLINEAYECTVHIPNLKDRANRVQLIAETLSKLHKTNEAFEAIQMAKELALSLNGYDRDSVLAAVIQTAHQIDKHFGEEVTEKIEDPSVQYNLDSNLIATDLAKAPHKLTTTYSNSVQNNEIMKNAAIKMKKAIVSGRGVSFSQKLIIEWLYATRFLDFDASKEVVDWAIEAAIRHAPQSNLSSLAAQIINSLTLCCELLYKIGCNLSTLYTIPESLKFSFYGLSTQKKLFRVGERDKAINYISEWLKNNSQEYVIICDPYFDKEQLWILMKIPTDLEVKIICTGEKFGLKNKKGESENKDSSLREQIKVEKQRIKFILDTAWDDLSKQSPPPTLVVIHGTIYQDQDEFHDRFIVTKNAGLSIGTSLNGFGNKEFFITLLTQDTIEDIYAEYIKPKLDIQNQFSKVIYFELDE